MSNKKKLKSRDGATRIVPVDNKYGVLYRLYKLQVYSKASDSWNDLEGCKGLSWKKAATARKNYIGLRDACSLANKGVIRIALPNEGNGN